MELKEKTAKPATSGITKATRFMSFKKTGKKSLYKKVLETLDGKQLTAREIAVEMHSKGLLLYPARSVIQPRITELVENGVIKAVGIKLDEETNRKVAVYEVVSDV